VDRLVDNLVHFGRVLRTAGLPVGTDRLLLAAQALEAGGLASRADFKATLATCLVDRPEHRPLFDQAFHVFWRDPDLLGRIMALLLPQARGRTATPPPPENRRLADALFPAVPVESPRTEQVDIEARLDAGNRELLQRRDFDTMTAAEWAAARQALAALQPRLAQQLTRRHAPAPHGRIAWRATLRAEARRDSALPTRERARRHPTPLVLLADISGSMGRYSRVLLHLAQGLLNPAAGAGAAPVVEAFVFGTRLTRITRQLKGRDPDAALAAVSAAVPDWAGGTRISQSLHAFNRDWARRVLGGGAATVLLVTDGLERDAADGSQLAFEAERLRLSCRELVWLNPLLRFEAFQPRAAGVKALLPQVSRHLPVHDLDSIDRLLDALAR
jgi:uncharacterized protein with von Willebrand factor type A (vWA) domain